MMFIGIDISKEKIDLSWLRDQLTNKIKTKVFKNKHQDFLAIEKWLLNTTKSAANELVITLEPTGVYHEALMYFLHEQGFNIILANPGKAKKYADALNIIHKTDKSDATMLAHYGCAKHAVVSYWQPDALEVRELKALIRRLDALESNRQREANRLEASEFSNVSARVCQSIKVTIAFLDDEIKQLKSDIDNHIDNEPDLKRNRKLLESIPGIGPVLSRELTYLFA
ncbi:MULTISPECIES: IS110 family transposase, partial [Pseudoalteromonas]